MIIQLRFHGNSFPLGWTSFVRSSYFLFLGPWWEKGRKLHSTNAVASLVNETNPPSGQKYFCLACWCRLAKPSISHYRPAIPDFQYFLILMFYLTIFIFYLRIFVWCQNLDFLYVWFNSIRLCFVMCYMLIYILELWILSSLVISMKLPSGLKYFCMVCWSTFAKPSISHTKPAIPDYQYFWILMFYLIIFIFYLRILTYLIILMFYLIVLMFYPRFWTFYLRIWLFFMFHLTV